MTTRLPVEGPNLVSCSICHREVPHAETLSAEGQDYFLYFCGTDCYEQWQHSTEGEEPATTDRKGQHE
jgi:YHS domain-containing protein